MMMKLSKFASVLAVPALLLSSPVTAEDTPEPAEQTGPALWKAADEDTTIYLFGTVHALPPELQWFDGAIADALKSSDSVVTEIKMDESMAGEMQRLVMETGLLPEGTSLRAMMEEDERADFDAAMGKLGIPAMAFDRYEPWYAGLMMSMLPLMQQGYTPDSGVEAVILREAGDKPTGALETLEYQIGLFDGLPEDAQLAFLIEASRNVDDIKDQLDAMIAEWVEGDAVELAKLMNEGMTDEDLADTILYKRNRNWAEWIDTRLDDPGTVFIAVGAGHLAGDQSVQAALGERGIEVVRVR